MALLMGRLLVASPRLVDPNFFRAVVLLLNHDEEGAVGVVLNRPSETGVAEVLSGWEELADDPQVVFVGGPVQPEAAVCLARPDPHAEGVEGFSPLIDIAGSFDLDTDPTLAAPVLERLRVFAGYAGWSPGQLETEVESGDWFVVDALPDDAFGPAPHDLWRRVLRRQRNELRIVAEYPLHPSLN